MAEVTEVTQVTEVTEKNVKTYRYKFSPDVVKLLFEFSKLHQFENRKDYKESWEQWVKDNEETISCETRRLTQLDYSGNVVDKMYKSARYYFRSKTTAKVEPKKRRKYSACNRDFIENMDTYILENYKKNNEFKPSDKYSEYCEQNKDLLNDEIERIKKEDHYSNEVILDKIKQLFKKRYFQLIKNK
jgi:hypothetical protein